VGAEALLYHTNAQMLLHFYTATTHLVYNTCLTHTPTQGGRDETTETEDVVVNLLERDKQYKIEKEHLHQQLEERRRKHEGKKLQNIAHLSNRVHQDAKLRKMAAHARIEALHAQENAHKKEEEAEALHRHLILERQLMQAQNTKPGEREKRAKASAKTDDQHEVRPPAETGRHEREAIPQVVLTDVQDDMLLSSVIRHAEDRERRTLAAEDREKQERARLFTLKEAQKDDMLADELRRERALERQLERERQTDLKTVPQGQHFDFVADVRQVLCICVCACV
jgi:hypothetical protein